MKILLVSSVLFLLFFTSCKESNLLPSEPDIREQFEINFLQYSDNNYFIRNISPSLEDYKHQEIYDTLKSLLALPENIFVLRGKFTPE